MTTDPKPTTCRAEQRTPTREELEADISIGADFDEVMDAIIAGHGTGDGHHPI